VARQRADIRGPQTFRQGLFFVQWLLRRCCRVEIDSEEEVRKTAFACLKRIELKKKVRLVGVRASNFQGKSKDNPHRPEVLDRLI